MPELPEVQTIREQLSAYLPLKISSIKLSEVASSIVHTPMEKLRGKTIERVWRKGKMLVFEISDKRKILSHLGMTGSWRVSSAPLKERHNHIQIKGENNGEAFYLSYVDPRRFGHLYLYGPAEAQSKLNELGVDLKSPDFTFDYFKNALKKYPERHVKVSLLDQSLFAGTGNYIANEICARAYVRPQRKIKTLTEKEITALYHAVDVVVSGATESGGTTFQGGYADVNGDKGKGVQHLVVFYQKTCQMCKETPVKKIVLGQRGTYYCPKCQK